MSIKNYGRCIFRCFQTAGSVSAASIVVGVFVKKLGKNKYNIMIYNQHTQEVITVLKSTTKNKLLQLGNNYGWIL